MNRRKIHRRFLRLGWYLGLIRVMQSIKLNQRRTNLYQTLVQFSDDLSKNNLTHKANGVAFSFTLAIFPAIIFVFTLTPYINHVYPHLHSDAIIEFLSNVMPESMFEVATETITDIVSIKREGLLSFGFIFALFLATNGMHGLMSAFNSIYKTNDKRGYIKSRFVAMILTFMLCSVLFSAIFLMVIGKSFLLMLEDKGFFSHEIYLYLLFALKYGIIAMAFFIAISLIYYFAPAIHDRWTFFSAGAFFASFGCVVASFGFSFYINNFGSYNKLYGSLGMLIALMIWLFLLAIILLLGFMYNASVDRAVVSDKIEVTTSIFD